MKITAEKQKLISSLSTAMRAVSLKATLPILSNICLTAENGKLKVSSTNLELGLNYWCVVKVEQEGSLTVPGRVLLEFINSLNSESVTLETKEEMLSITSPDGDANIAGIVSSEFPSIPSLSPNANIFLDPKEFQKAVSQVAFAASTDTGRAVLNGILLHFTPESVLLVSTDGYRLAQKSWQRETGVNESVIIPAKSLFEISRCINEAASEGEELKVEINKEKNQALFGLEKVHMTTRLLDGQYPNYQQIIPQNFISRALIDTEQLNRAVRTAGVFAKDVGSVIKVTFSPSNKITLSASTNQLGDSKTTVEASFEGEQLTMAFNQRYLQEALAVVSTTQISVEITSEKHPAVIKGVGDNSYLHLIMPVRLQG